jgi:hypothetical protein
MSYTTKLLTDQAGAYIPPSGARLTISEQDSGAVDATRPLSLLRQVFPVVK